MENNTTEPQNEWNRKKKKKQEAQRFKTSKQHKTETGPTLHRKGSQLKTISHHTVEQPPLSSCVLWDQLKNHEETKWRPQSRAKFHAMNQNLNRRLFVIKTVLVSLFPNTPNNHKERWSPQNFSSLQTNLLLPGFKKVKNRRVGEYTTASNPTKDHSSNDLSYSAI